MTPEFFVDFRAWIKKFLRCLKFLITQLEELFIWLSITKLDSLHLEKEVARIGNLFIKKNCSYDTKWSRLVTRRITRLGSPFEIQAADLTCAQCSYMLYFTVGYTVTICIPDKSGIWMVQFSNGLIFEWWSENRTKYVCFTVTNVWFSNDPLIWTS